jgi:hypothetical protein
MGAMQLPSEFVRPGNVVFVVTSGRMGISGWKRREVAKVGKMHFTVEGIESGGKPVQFRNREGSFGSGLSYDVPMHAAAAEHVGMVVMEDGTEATADVRRRMTERLAINRVAKAADAWRKIEDARTSHTHHDRRPSAADVDAALVELAAAAVELRGVLGVPEGAEA